MIDLLEKTETGWKRVAIAPLAVVHQIGLIRFIRIQGLLERKMVWVREGENEVKP